jgi:predicted TPR repeat methyltransferase
MEKLQATTDAPALKRRVRELVQAKRPAAARHLLPALRRLMPPSPELTELAARIALDEGKPQQALAELDAAVAAAPEHPGLRKCRADLRNRLGDIDGALADAAEAVVQDRTDPAAKALLGILLLDVRRPADAITCLQDAVAAEPVNPFYRQGLAAAQEAMGDADAAMATLAAGIAMTPRLVELHNAAILLAMRQRDFATACRLSEVTRAAGVADACSFGLMGHALSSLGRHAEAADAYAEALKLGPDDPYVRHLVAAAGVVPGADRAPVEYLRAVFNGYAERFEAHLISLGYRIPGLMRAMLASHPDIIAGRNLGAVLDFGCGTGLVAVALSDLPIGPLTGVDVSPRMLELAKAKQLYAELHEDDVIEFLGSCDTRWPLIVAADVVIYFGALEDLFAAVHARLAPGGWFVFSVEGLLPDRDGNVPGNGRWALQRQGRYVHAPAYIADLAANAGFTTRCLDREVVRFEADAPVPGFLVVLERPVHDH